MEPGIAGMEISPNEIHMFPRRRVKQHGLLLLCEPKGSALSRLGCDSEETNSAIYRERWEV